ncbi:glycosyl transferase [Comamonadaceae bacterium OH2545_COT-014]|nr:glycosyl transferase [Comamonadaceae bacterium OH2545_COT-014]
MRLSLSIVSHGHGAQVWPLLQALAALAPPRPARVLLTLNLPDAPLAAQVRAAAWPFELALLENAAPAGFGANHNRAFAHDQQRPAPGEAFAVLNPDLQLHGNPFAPLLAALAVPGTGCAYPHQCDAQGRPQDHERRLPTPARLLARYGRGRRAEVGADAGDGAPPDWVNAAFLVLRAQAYAQIGGFDEGYHMYCEDVDLCLRLQLAGWQLRRADGACVTHAAQRASHRNLRHLAWHVRSLLRLWASPAYAQYRRQAHGSQRPHQPG